jgi:hypothetical protein
VLVKFQELCGHKEAKEENVGNSKHHHQGWKNPSNSPNKKIHNLFYCDAGFGQLGLNYIATYDEKNIYTKKTTSHW